MHALDIYRAAKLLVNRHGAEAVGKAWDRVTSLCRHSGVQEGAVWKQIREAVLKLQRTMRDPGETEH